MENGDERSPVGQVSTCHPIDRFATRLAPWWTFVLCLAGCRGEPAGFDRYIPASSAARAAVVAVLEAWRDGRPPESLAAGKPSVCVVDKQRKPEQRLARFEVLGEVSTDKARGFAVRLSLENPDRQDVVRFLVVGIDPLWVFRQEDYELISHWMHPMDETSQDPSTSTPPVPTP